ncbi:MAG TPA: ribose ABC transporter permease, partial [Pseudolysinimonas sp.]|nr:ribose ABC transporter permease [Pseudolysinimonas sp.]
TMYRDGSPRVLGSLVGVAILGVLANGLNIIGVSSYVQQAVTGLIIILAVAIPSFSARRKAR